MSDGEEERKEQEERRRWEERKDREDDLDRDGPREEERERRDSRAADSLVAMRGEGGVRAAYAAELSDCGACDDYWTKLGYDWYAGI